MREKENDMKNSKTTERQTTRGIRRIACNTALGMALTVGLPLAAHAQGVTPPPVPTDIQVEEGNEAFLLGRGVGTQNYVCQPAASVGRVAWTLFTPQATLFSDEHEQLTTHFFSPNPVRAQPYSFREWPRTRHLAGLAGHEHRLGQAHRFRHGQPERDSLAPAGNGWRPSGTNGGRHAGGDHVHSTTEYRRRVGTRDRLRHPDRCRP